MQGCRCGELRSQKQHSSARDKAKQHAAPESAHWRVGGRGEGRGEGQRTDTGLSLSDGHPAGQRATLLTVHHFGQLSTCKQHEPFPSFQVRIISG